MGFLKKVEAAQRSLRIRNSPSSIPRLLYPDVLLLPKNFGFSSLFSCQSFNIPSFAFVSAPMYIWDVLFLCVLIMLSSSLYIQDMSVALSIVCFYCYFSL